MVVVVVVPAKHDHRKATWPELRYLNGGTYTYALERGHTGLAVSLEFGTLQHTKLPGLLTIEITTTMDLDDVTTFT